MSLKIYMFSQIPNKFLNEIFFICLFVSVITVNKFVLSELKFTVPTVFQGWQTLSCVALLSAFYRYKNVKNDLQILDAKALYLLLPALVCFALGIVAGSKALANLHVPVFLAITNLYPAILIFLIKKEDLSKASLQVCGSTAVLGITIVILISTFTSHTTSPILWLLAHIFLNILYCLYLNKLNLDLTNTTQIYYRNFFSIIVLFPISFYLDVLHLPRNGGWQFYGGCFLSGVLGTLLQIWTFKVASNPNYLQFEGFSKVVASLIAYKVFYTDIEPFVWVLIIMNFLICATFLKGSQRETVNVKSEINLSIPPPHTKTIDSDLILLV